MVTTFDRDLWCPWVCLSVWSGLVWRVCLSVSKRSSKAGDPTLCYAHKQRSPAALASSALRSDMCVVWSVGLDMTRLSSGQT